MDLSRFYFINKNFYESICTENTDVLKNFATLKSFKKGSDLFTEGDYPKGVYILEKGKIKIYQTTFEGVQQIMNIHVEGEIIGYRPLLCDGKYPVTATAIEDGTVTFIPKKHFLNTLENSTILSNILLKFLSYEFTVWVNTISNLKQRTVKERLMVNLLVLIEKYRAKKRWPVQITLSRTDFAALIGTSNETLARLLKVLKDENYIATKGRTIIVSSADQEAKIRKSLLGLF